VHVTANRNNCLSHSPEAQATLASAADRTIRPSHRPRPPSNPGGALGTGLIRAARRALAGYERRVSHWPLSSGASLTYRVRRAAESRGGSGVGGFAYDVDDLAKEGEPGLGVAR
jgi:hypothetical protein